MREIFTHSKSISSQDASPHQFRTPRRSLIKDKLTRRVSNVPAPNLAPNFRRAQSVVNQNWDKQRTNVWLRHKNATWVSFCQLWERIGPGILRELTDEHNRERATKQVDEARKALDAVDPADLAKLADTDDPSPRLILVMHAVCLLININNMRTGWARVRKFLRRSDFKEKLLKSDAVILEFMLEQHKQDKIDYLYASSELKLLARLRMVHAQETKAAASAAATDTNGSVWWCIQIFVVNVLISHTP